MIRQQNHRDRLVQSLALVLAAIAVGLLIPDRPARAGSFKFYAVDQMGGESAAAAVRPPYAYVGTGPSLYVMDVSQPANPVRVGRVILWETVQDVELVGNYAYVALLQRGIQIVDISNPASPVVVGGVALSGYPWSVALAGQYAFVAADEGGLHVVDVLNPASPVRVYTDASHYPSDVEVVGNLAYVTDWLDGLRILDISNPTAPVQVGSYGMPQYVFDVTMSGNYAYVSAFTNGLKVLDISNPLTPTKVADVALSNPSHAEVAGNYLYVALVGPGSGLSVLDITNPLSPVQATPPYQSEPMNSVAVGGDYAYLSPYYSGKLSIVRVVPPAAPALVGSYTLPYWATDVAIANNHAFTNQFDIIDVSNPAALVCRRVGSSYYDLVRAQGNNLHMVYATRWDIYDVSNPLGPVFKRSVTLSYEPSDLVFQGDYAYAAGGSSGLRIYNVADPNGPSEIGNLPIADGASRVTVSGHLALIGTPNTDRGLTIVDVTNPAAPILLGTGTTLWSEPKAAVDGSYAYLATQGDVEVFDISNPAAAVRIASVTGLGDGADILIRDARAYVANSGSGIHVLDISNPASPSVLDEYHAAGSASRVLAKDRYILASCGHGGLLTLEPMMDCNGNHIPDEQESDSDGDGVIDDCDQCPGTPPGWAVDAVGCPISPSRDFDGDGDVDGADANHIRGCLTGEHIPFIESCRNADLDRDGDVDLSDYGLFQRCLSGQGHAFDPGCLE